MDTGSLRQLTRRLRYGRPITIVSGLPRSGTSMMMRMLEAGGMPILTDHTRTADESNPHGYFEFEAVKQLDQPGADRSWLLSARGKAVKIISFLLTWLPETYDYRVVMMERDIAEILASQKQMLAARREELETGALEGMDAVYEEHLTKVKRFLASRSCFETIDVQYRHVVEEPATEAMRIADFLSAKLDIEAMIAAVDPMLYRNRPRVRPTRPI